MSDYSTLNTNLILAKTNPIVGIKMTEFPQYKSAITDDVKFKMSQIDKHQLPNILTKDVDNSFQTINNIYKNNMLFKSKYSF